MGLFLGPGAAHVRDSPDGPEKGPPTNPLLTGGTRRVVAHNEKPTKRPKSQKPPKKDKNRQISAKWPKMPKMAKMSKKGENGKKGIKYLIRR